MKPEEDAYGQALLAHYQGMPSFEIVERDDGYFDVSSYGTKTYFSEYPDWMPIEQQAMTFVQGTVLDVGCGAGRHALYLQAQGYDVTGIDVSPLAIKVCQMRGLQKAQVMAIEDLQFPTHSFDTILMMGNNFGLMGSCQKARQLLQQFHHITTDEATIIAFTLDVYQTENPDHLEYQVFNRQRGRMSGQLRIRIRYKKFVTPWFDYLIVSQQEMQEIIKDTGWKIQELLQQDSPTYLAIIKKE
ncbi:MAG: class I SAM-dependent methyltransferase [Candidatus Bathyarchaeota archaeon]|nr:class I SAM-dependent methyltransferase [Candidatus Bathyarchaeota archaeon]